MLTSSNTTATRAAPSPVDDYARIEEAIAFLRARRGDQPGLQELADHLRLSATHTQRLFSRWAGISPKRFVQYLTVEHAKRRMAETGDLLSLAHDSGLSGPGRLHDLFVNLEAMSPGEYRRAAQDVAVAYGVAPTPFGMALVAYTSRGICHLSFRGVEPDTPLRAQLTASWPAAALSRDDAAAAELLAQVFGQCAPPPGGLSLWVSGTNFQVQVWRALLRVPRGGLLSYRQLAHLVGQPRAARAVGTAMARNPIACLIPCHRVLRESGEFGTYHWGSERKMALCAWEAAARDAAAGTAPSAEEIAAG
ncbi:MAG: methylated-DNA--[protein]-cysteine S-methyltransferase [Gammaproteobacteria bacterium]|nr:methylated-DNA--[protein]-cysteine S-methyltransferase [Gammaproteobacteria bacterium]